MCVEFFFEVVFENLIYKLGQAIVFWDIYADSDLIVDQDAVITKIVNQQYHNTSMVQQ